MTKTKIPRRRCLWGLLITLLFSGTILKAKVLDSEWVSLSPPEGQWAEIEGGLRIAGSDPAVSFLREDANLVEAADICVRLVLQSETGSDAYLELTEEKHDVFLNEAERRAVHAENWLRAVNHDVEQRERY